MSLLQLPNELILMIVSQLALIHPFDDHEPYIDAFQRYQEENEQRLGALAALCCTSKTLRNIATPELYSAFVLYSGGSYMRLMGFLRTLITKPELQKKVKYIHMSPHDSPQAGLAESEIWESEWGFLMGPTKSMRNIFLDQAKEVERMWGPDQEAFKSWLVVQNFSVSQATLSIIMALAVNLEHLAIIRTSQQCTEILPLFNFCGEITEPPHTGCPIRFHRLRNLVLSNEKDLFEDRMPDSEIQFLDLTGICPSLRQVKLSGYVRLIGFTSGDKRLPLDSLHLRNSNIIGPVTHQISKCAALVRLNINWPFFWMDDSLPSLREALLMHKDTLKYLTMEMGGSLCEHVYPIWNAENQLGSLASFNALQNLNIPSIMLLGTPPSRNIALAKVDRWWAANSGTHRISDLLPPTLEELKISEIFFLGTSIPVLQDLADDKAQLPGLCTVELRSRLIHNVRYLEDTFASHGVSFRQVSLLSIPPGLVRDVSS